MLNGEYTYLVENIEIARVISFILLIIPIALMFYKFKYLIGFYAISIVANLPIIFNIAFNLSYEIIIVALLLIKFVKVIYDRKLFRYKISSDAFKIVFALFLILFINIFTSLFNFNEKEFFNRFIIYVVNVFVLFIFSYFINRKDRREFIGWSMLIGGIILVISQLIELWYGYYLLGIKNLRPGGFLLDPNVLAFTLNLVLAISFSLDADNKALKMIYLFSARLFIVFGVFLTVSRSGYISSISILLIIMFSKLFDKRFCIIPITVVLVFVLMAVIFNKQITNFLNNMYEIIDLKRIWNRPPPQVIPDPNNPGTGGIIELGYDNLRLELIFTGIKIFINNLLIGVGIGNVVYYMGSIIGVELNTHNIVVQLAAESGITILIAIAIFVYFVIKYIVRIQKKYKFSLIFISVLFVLEGMFNHNFLNINITYIILAYFISFGLQNNKNIIEVKRDFIDW